MSEQNQAVTCRDCGGRPTGTCDRCGADVPYSENASTLAWLLRRRQREQRITRPTPDTWDLALWLDRAGATVAPAMLACREPSCPNFGDPDFGEATCPQEHADPPARVRAVPRGPDWKPCDGSCLCCVAKAEAAGHE